MISGVYQRPQGRGGREGGRERAQKDGRQESRRVIEGTCVRMSDVCGR